MLIDITNHATTTIRSFPLAPRTSEIRESVLPAARGELQEVGTNEYGFTHTIRTLTRGHLFSFLIEHERQDHLYEPGDGSLLVMWSEQSKAHFQRGKWYATRQPYELTIPARIVYDLEMHYGYPLRLHIQDLIKNERWAEAKR